MFKIKLMLLVGAILLLNGCSSKSDYKFFQTEEAAVAEQAIPNYKVEYKLQPQDRLSINLYKYPELMPTSMSGEGRGLLLDSNGDIHLPLIKRTKLAGLTEVEAARLLEQKYKVYLTDPTLHIEVLNKRIYVLGEVNKPGVIELDKEKLTIIEALAFAGDLTDSAIREDIIIISHNLENKMVMRSVDMLDFRSLTLANLMIKPNDIIYVQPNGWKTFKVKSQDVTSILDPIIKIASTYAVFALLAD